MAHRAGRDHYLFMWFCTVRRWLLSRQGNLLMTLAFVGVIVLWVNLNFSDTILESTSGYPVERSVYPYLAVDVYRSAETPSPAEVERQRRMAIFSHMFHKQARKRWRGRNETQCIHPRLDLKHDANRFAYYDMPPLNCTSGGAFHFHKGMLKVNTSGTPSPSMWGRCSFYSVSRENDNMFTYSEFEVMDSPPFDVHFPHDFARIQCLLKSTLEEQEASDDTKKKEVSEQEDEGSMQREQKEKGSNDTAREEDDMVDENVSNDKDKDDKKDNALDHDETNRNDSDHSFVDYFGDMDWPYSNYGEFFDPDYEASDFDQFLVQVHPKPEVFERIAKVETVSGKRQLKLNVLMFALDSMSHLCYQRKLPMTYKFLKNELGAAILENYNIVGDATTAAIIPMLTGLTEMDLPEVRQSKLEGGTVDEYPLIWKKFVQQGYATFFAEDEPSLSTFNLRLNGFHDPPTDHYMRPFWQALWESSLRQSSERFCTGNTAHHRFMLGYLEDFFLKYNNVSRFAFGFHGELTHADNNPAQYIDADLTALLRRLKRKKVLEDTVVIVFGDHGARYSKVRYTVQGKLEERLPMMSFAFPPKFHQLYPHLYQNLLTNVHRLTTPFDIHQTLLDIMNLSQTAHAPSAGRGISLLREIPADRTCHDAGISMHWCACLKQVIVETEDEFVQRSAEALLEQLNTETSLHRKQCAEQSLKAVLNAQMVLPNEKVLKYRRSKDADQREANFSRDIDLDVVHYQLQVETKPCGALYEATIMADFRNYTEYRFTVTPGISRINKYGSQPMCVQENYPMLRKFCCCRDYLRQQQYLGQGKQAGSDKTRKARDAGKSVQQHGAA